MKTTNKTIATSVESTLIINKARKNVKKSTLSLNKI
jgi:hypothetical protein